MGLSRQEVNLRRVLAKCELKLKSKEQDEALPKYVASLEDMLREIIKSTEKPQEEAISEYKRRIYNIKKTLGLDLESDKDFYLNAGGALTFLKQREELLGLRQRNVQQNGNGIDDLEEIVNYHQREQDKIANEMLTMTQSLKEQSQLANKIIKNDTEIVGRSSALTDQNYSNLKTESDKLTDHSKRACKCWMWVMLLVVCFVFINMVLFMKVMKKKQ